MWESNIELEGHEKSTKEGAGKRGDTDVNPVAPNQNTLTLLALK